MICRGQPDTQSEEVRGYVCRMCALLQTAFIVQPLHRLHLLPALLCPLFRLFLPLPPESTLGNTLLLSEEQYVPSALKRS